MRAVEVLRDGLGRVASTLPSVLDGLDADDLAWRPDPAANSIGWLLWHLARVEDAHVAQLMDERQLWQDGPWATDLGLEPDPSNSGYGHTPEQAAAIRPPDAAVLQDYFDAVRARTDRYLGTVSEAQFDEVVDRSYDPPVTRGVRLVSIIEDELQHLGQASYLRGLLERRS